MSEYRYTDIDGDRLLVDTAGWPNNTAHIVVHENAVFVPAAEAPKTAQAILDAAGVQGSVMVGELPEVSETYWGGSCVVNGTGNTIPCDPKYLDRTMLELLAVKAHVQAREAGREAGLAKVREEADRLVAEKKAHDGLRTSPIALKALAIYNRVTEPMRPYTSWDTTNDGYGCDDAKVIYYIGRAEAEEAKEKEAAEKLAAHRDAVAKDYFNWNYEGLTANGKRVIDRIIELEDAQ